MHQISNVHLLSVSTPEFATYVLLRRQMHAHDLWSKFEDTNSTLICICSTTEFVEKNVAFGDARYVFQESEMQTPFASEVLDRIFETLLGRPASDGEKARWASETELAFGVMCSEICWTLEFQQRVRSGYEPGQSLDDKRRELLLFSKFVTTDCYNSSLVARVKGGYSLFNRDRVIQNKNTVTVDTVLFDSLQEDADYVRAELGKRLPNKTIELRFRSEADIAESGFRENEAQGRTTIYLTNNNLLYNRLGEIALRLAESKNVISACWLFDNHHQFSFSMRTAAIFDIVFPAHCNNTDYLYDGNAIVGPVVPPGVIQWSRAAAIEFYRQTGAVERDDELYGRFTSYAGRVTARDRFLNAVQAEPFGNTVLVFDAPKQDWSSMGPLDRFVDFTRHKVAVSTPILNDVPIRVFDSLLTGQIPIVPFGSLGLEVSIPSAAQLALPVLTYLPNDVRSLNEAYCSAILAFDAEGQIGADRRHEAAVGSHMLAHRVIDMISYIISVAKI